MTVRRTTLSADPSDLAVLEGEARRRGISLARVLREAVAREADDIRARRRPRFGIVHGKGDATRRIAEDENAPAGRPYRS